MAELSAQTSIGTTRGEATFGSPIPILRRRMGGIVATSMSSYAPRYAALMRDLCRARSVAANRCDWVQFRALGEEVAMVGAIIAHQTHLREAAAA